MLTGQVQLQFFNFLLLNLCYDYIQDHLRFELVLQSAALSLDAGALHWSQLEILWQLHLKYNLF